MADSLTEVIDKLVQERTFGLEGLEGVKRIKDHAVTLEKKLQERSEIIAARDTQVSTLTAKVGELNRTIEGLRAREDDVAAREAKVRDLELKEAVATAKATTLDGVFNTIFRNVTVRENAVRAVPFTNTQPGGYSNSGHMPMSETSERTSD